MMNDKLGIDSMHYALYYFLNFYSVIYVQNDLQPRCIKTLVCKVT